MNKKIIHLGIDWEDFALVFFDRGMIKDYRFFSNDFYVENEYLLSYLNKESIKATFFCNARTAEIYPDLFKKLYLADCFEALVTISGVDFIVNLTDCVSKNWEVLSAGKPKSVVSRTHTITRVASRKPTRSRSKTRRASTTSSRTESTSWKRSCCDCKKTNNQTRSSCRCNSIYIFNFNK